MSEARSVSAILSPRQAEDEVAEAREGPATAPGHATTGTGMSAMGSTRKVRRRTDRLLLARRGRQWDADDVARHLMACREQMVCGLRRKTPWAGLDLDTLDSCFGHGAAIIVKVAVSGQRPEWRTAKDLEKAQIAAFRHQALDHWKRVNARSRQGDRMAVAFDPDRHSPQDAPMDRLFEQPDLHAIQRDLTAELADAELRVFWTAVLSGPASFKAAGDQLGLSKAQVMARTRAGRSVFADYLDRRETGELCRERGVDIVALRGGTASEERAERAEAHLEACYSCSLVHQPQTSAFERGILGITPIGLLLRMAMRAGEVASIPATRWTEAGAGARLAAGGLAALTVTGAGVSIEAATKARRVTERPPRPGVSRVVPAAPPERIRTPALLLPAVRPAPAPTVSVMRRAAVDRGAARHAAAGSGAAKRSARLPMASAPEPPPSPPTPPPAGAATTRVTPPTGPVGSPEFSFERGSVPSQTPARAAGASKTAAGSEFSAP